MLQDVTDDPPVVTDHSPNMTVDEMLLHVAENHDILAIPVLDVGEPFTGQLVMVDPVEIAAIISSGTPKRSIVLMRIG